MRIQWKGTTTPDLGGLSRALWEPALDSDRAADADSGCGRGDRWKEGHRRPRPAMPGETARRSIFRLPVYLPHPAWHGHQGLTFDGQGFWLATKRLSKGRFRWWPTGDGTGADAASASGAVAAGGRQSGDGSPAGVAAGELIEQYNKTLAFRFRLWHTDGRWRRVEISRAGDHSRQMSLSFASSSPSIRAAAGGSCREKLCEAWQWKQANGALRDMVCRGLLLMLHRAGEIELPPSASTLATRSSGAQRPAPMLIDTTPIAAPLKELRPIELQQVRRTGDEPLFNSLMEQYHYLSYEQPVGEHLKYLVWAQGRPIACLAWSSAPRHLGSRDRYIGWSAEARRRNIRFIAYNTRFLILPWVQVPHLASHILGRMRAILSDDWQRMYGHPVYFAETFIDPGAFSRDLLPGGELATARTTTGRGKNDQTNKPNRPIKEVLGLPLTPRFRELLSQLMMMTIPPADRREPGRTGPDHRSQHARAAERIRRREAQNRAACAGRETAAANGTRRKPEPF